jgi:hypothetical protein
MQQDLTPASSPAIILIISVLKPRRSAKRKYIRIIIDAQSWLSVPPAPALISRKQLLTSASPENRHSVSNFVAILARSVSSFST